MENHLKLFGLLGALMIAAALAVLFACDPLQVPIYPVCVFHRVTGLNCPGCGSLRAMHQLLHGNLREALHLNALLVLSLPFFAWIAFRIARQQIKGTPGMAVRPAWLWAYFGLWLAFGIVRELPMHLFAAWSP